MEGEMGYMCHHGLFVTSYSRQQATQAHAKATEIYGRPKPCPVPGNYASLVSPVQESAVNSYYSFAIFPDGSKEFWPDSDESDGRRKEFIAWMNEQRFEDGSSPFAWAEVRYGDEEGDNILCRSDADPVEVAS